MVVLMVVLNYSHNHTVSIAEVLTGDPLEVSTLTSAPALQVCVCVCVCVCVRACVHTFVCVSSTSNCPSATK